MDPTRRVIGTASGWIAAAFVLAGCGAREQRMAPPPAPRDGVVQPPGAEQPGVAPRIERTWARGEAWRDLVVDARSGDIYGIRRINWRPADRSWTARICRISRQGVIEHDITVAGRESSPTKLLLLSGRADEQPAFAVFKTPDEQVYAFDSNGALLWARVLSSSVSGAQAIDLDSDGIDELLVASGKGVLAFDRTGVERWRSREGKFIGGIVAIPGRPGEKPHVFVDSGGLHVLDPITGDVVRSLRERRTRPQVGLFWPSSRIAGPQTYEVVSADADPPVRVQALNADGTVAWMVADRDPTLRGERVSEVACSMDGRWVAVALKYGRVLLIDAQQRTRAALVVANASVYPSVAWSVTADGTPLLLVGSARGIDAFTVQPPAE
ncbi:PQQ-like beta-propeller repeat protein [Leptolyngbya sp. 15MV]|nr:PQQ-like beta-propeller repeat protein [Leptolyngbya sp. 15MV]